MGFPVQFKIMPQQAMRKLYIAFCLMSLLPVFAFVYVVFVAGRLSYEENPAGFCAAITVCVIAFVLSFLGYRTIRDVAAPIDRVRAAAKSIADGEGIEDLQIRGCDELEELVGTLKRISQNAHDLLTKVDCLSPKDKLTDLYNAVYIRERLAEEIQRAIHFQRPCAFALIKVDQMDAFVMRNGKAAGEEALKAIAKIIGKYLGEFDRAAHIAVDEFGIIFPDKNKKKTIEVIELIQSDVLAFKFGKNETLTTTCGISENPLDGVQAQNLFEKAVSRVAKAAARAPGSLEAFA